MKYSWLVVSPIYLASGLVLIWLINFTFQSLPEFSLNLILAGGVYFSAHLLRAIRLWLVMSEAELDFSQLTFSHLFGSSLGNISYPVVKDLAVAGLLWSQNSGQLVKICLSLIYIRLFDWCILLPLLIPVLLGQAKSTQALAGVLFGLGLIALIGLVLLPRLTSFIQTHFLRHHHHQGGLTALKLTSLIKTKAESMKLGQLDKVFILLLNTLVIWLLEVAAVWLVVGQNLAQALEILGQNVLLASAGETTSYYLVLYFGLAVWSLIAFSLKLTWPKSV